MSVEVPVCSERLPAQVAFIRFLAGVNPLVLLQTAGVEKLLPTHGTDIRLLSGVAPLVIAERVFVVEGLPAQAAVVLFVLTVASLVKFERGCGTETFQTDFTAERFG